MSLKNATSAEITVAQLIEKLTKLAPGDSVELDAGTVAVEIR